MSKSERWAWIAAVAALFLLAANAIMLGQLLDRIPLRGSPVPVTLGDEVEVNVANVTAIPVEVENYEVPVDVRNFSVPVEVMNAVDVANEVDVNLKNHYIIGADPIPVEISP